MSPAAQAKILRAVELAEFERLGSEQLLEADRAARSRRLTCRWLRYRRLITFGKICSTGSAGLPSGSLPCVSGPTISVPSWPPLSSRRVPRSANTVVGLSRAAADRLR